MAFQNALHEQARGVEGTHWSQENNGGPTMCRPAREDVHVGYFAWWDTATNTVTNTQVAGQEPAGLVLTLRTEDAFPETNGTGFPWVRQGRQATVALAGEYWVKCTNASAIGNHVFTKIATDETAHAGAIMAGAAGATIEGYVDTGWIVVDADAANEQIGIAGGLDCFKRGVA